MFEMIFDNNKVLSAILLIAVLGDFIVPYTLAPFYKGYSHSTFVMSSLGNPNSPVHKIYNFWLILLGVLLLLSSKLIYIKYQFISTGLTISVIMLLSTFAIGAGIISGLFSVNESKEVVTTASKVHGVGASIGFIFLLFVPLMLSILSFKGKIICDGIIFLVCFILAFIFFILFIAAEKPKFKNTIIAREGMWQRLTLLFMYMPLICIAISELMCIK